MQKDALTQEIPRNSKLSCVPGTEGDTSVHVVPFHSWTRGYVTVVGLLYPTATQKVEVAHDTPTVAKLLWEVGVRLGNGCQFDAVTVGGDVTPCGDPDAPAGLCGVAMTAIEPNTSVTPATTAPDSARSSAPRQIPTLATSSVVPDR